MSWYHNYTIGIKRGDKIYPALVVGGHRIDVIVNSRSFEPDGLDDVFIPIKKENVTPELASAYHYEDGEEVEMDLNYMSWAKAEDLPSGSIYKEGYINALAYPHNDYSDKDEVISMIENGNVEYMSKDLYDAAAMNQIKFGVAEKQQDAEGYDLDVFDAREWIPFNYIDRYSAEYQAAVIRSAAAMVKDALPYDTKDEVIVILSQG